MSISRLVLGSVVAAAVAASVSTACSSFSANDEPGADDGGGATGSDARVGIDTGAADDAGTCDATLASDPQNCGKCGHSCLGGACTASECQPVLLGTSNDEAVVDVALDAQRVIWLTSTGFWSNLGHVFACPREGCPAGGPGLSLTGGPLSTGGLAGDGTNAFFSVAYGGNDVGVRTILPNGVPQRVGQPHAEAVRLQVRNGKLYYVTLYEGADAGYTGHVYRWDGAEVLVGEFASTHNLNDMVVVGDKAFFSGAEFLGACPLGTPEPPVCDPTDFVTTAGEYSSLTTDGTSVIWTDGSSILACRADQAKCAAPASVLGPANLGAPARGLVFDHGDLYVSTAGNDIFRCALPDCVGTLRKLVHEDRLFQSAEWAYGRGIAADDTAVYWTAVGGMEISDGGDGGSTTAGLTHRVMKVAK